MISYGNSLKNVLKEEKRLKTAEKSVLASLRVHPAPESWSKYTTPLDQHLGAKSKNTFLQFQIRYSSTVLGLQKRRMANI